MQIDVSWVYVGLIIASCSVIGVAIAILIIDRSNEK